MEARSMIEITKDELQDMLHKAAKTGAQEALERLGLEDKTATKDLEDMRQLVSSWRNIQTEVGRTAIRLVTTGILVFIGAAIWLSVKSKI
jgi:predicted ArsR family transcriptional regulator